MYEPESRNHNCFYEPIFIIVIFLLVNCLSYLAEDRISHNFGKGWDGRHYFALADQLASGQLPQAKAPFAYRIGTPYLASLLSTDNLLDSFLLVNILANAITVFLLGILFRMHIPDWRVRVILLAMFMCQWHGPIRFVYFYPAYTDPFMFVFLLAGLILLTKLSTSFSKTTLFCLSIVTFIGVFFRETVLLVALAALFIANPIEGRFFSWKGIKENIAHFRFILLLPLLSGFMGLAITHSVVSQTESFSFFITATNWAYEKALLSYVHSWFITFGPVLVILFYDRRNIWDYLMQKQYLFFVLFLTSVLAWIGGTDTERILYPSAAIVYILLGRAILNNKVLLNFLPFIVVLIGLQAVSQRLFWTIPDYPNDFLHKLPLLTSLGEEFPYLDLYATHGDRFIETISLLQYLLCLGFLLYFLYKRSKHLKKSDRH